MTTYADYDEDIEVTLQHQNIVVMVKPGTAAINILERDSNIIGVLSNNEFLSLQEPIDIRTTIQPIYKTDKEAGNYLTDTLSFIIQAAAQRCFP